MFIASHIVFYASLGRPSGRAPHQALLYSSVCLVSSFFLRDSIILLCVSVLEFGVYIMIYNNKHNITITYIYKILHDILKG